MERCKLRGMTSITTEEDNRWSQIAAAVMDAIERAVPRNSAERSAAEFQFGRELALLVVEAAQMFGSLEAGLAWMKAPNQSIGGKTPESLASSGSDGVAQARGILFRMEEGIFS